MYANVSLEVSLKPFWNTEEKAIREVCQRIFRQWYPLLKNRKSISLMLWTADGSEILDYAGRLEDSFEWCYWLGNANLPDLPEGAPEETTLHRNRRLYRKDPPVMTYRILRTIVSCLREEGKKAFPETEIRIGETFDIGPEFAISDFKYRRHPEVCEGASYLDNKLGFVDATALLHADSREYAGYPHGIPEGTPFGRFLGKQAQRFLSELGFDYLWLSNGLGFSADPWIKTGKVFDGERYDPDKLRDTKEKVFRFWKLFREECSFPLETRGTNNSVGIDYASDGVPLWDIYHAGLNITAPPNSPWAALNDDYGLEMMGHMSRICHLPSERFPFRYYLHDPWWLNSPWYDRYNSTPCDVYLPMAISRITEEGRVESANSLHLLSIDNSRGEMPDACVNEPLPHLLKAEKDAPDAVAPLVWIYPMREYTTSEDADALREMNLGDHFVGDAINEGLPLCCVASTDSFLGHSAELYRSSVLISPVPMDPEVKNKLYSFAQKGIGVVIYGTKEKLGELAKTENLLLVDSQSEPQSLVKATEAFGLCFRYEKQCRTKAPAMAISRSNGAHIFSVYNPNTTTESLLRLPMGAPVLDCGETKLVGGFASYRFSRSEHRECRVFVEQEEGILSLRERGPVNTRYRRKILLTGLKNATVRFFSETDCECAAAIPRLYGEQGEVLYHPDFEMVDDPVFGKHLLGRNVSGDLFFLIGHKNTI